MFWLKFTLLWKKTGQNLSMLNLMVSIIDNMAAGPNDSLYCKILELGVIFTEN